MLRAVIVSLGLSVCVPALAADGTWSASQHVEVVRIPKGPFLMGSSPSEPSHTDDEAQVSVTLTHDFAMMTTEVTQGLWEAVMGSNPSLSGQMEQSAKDPVACATFEGVSLVDGAYPVHCVSWIDAVTFANKLSAKDGLTPAYRIFFDAATWDREANGWRLPTEAEWERAARGGQQTQFAGADEEGGLCEVANVADATTKARWSTWTTASCNDGVAGLSRVGSYRANALGLYDMSGNVWEWTWDPYTKARLGGSDPSGPPVGQVRVIRGGGWSDGPLFARVAFRNASGAAFRSHGLGVRLVRSLP